MLCAGADTTKGPWRRRLQSGWSLIEVVVTTAIVGTLGVAVIMSMLPQVASSKRNQCMANLQMIESAKNSWVADHPGQAMIAPSVPNGPNDPLAQYIRGGVVPTTCPANGQAYTNSPNSSPTPSAAGMYDPTQPCYCPYHQLQAYATPPPS